MVAISDGGHWRWWPLVLVAIDDGGYWLLAIGVGGHW